MTPRTHATKAAADKHHPERRCIVTGKHHPAEGLLRFALSPEDVVVPDIRASLPGRGVWTRCQHDTVRQAYDKKLFARGFKEKVTVSDDLPEQVGRLLGEQALALLGMARKSGNLAVGLEPLQEQLVKDTIALICMASDAGSDGRDRLQHKKITAPMVSVFTRQQLETALGRNNVVYIGIKSVIVCATLCRAMERVAAYAGAHDTQDADADACTTPK